MTQRHFLRAMAVAVMAALPLAACTTSTPVQTALAPAAAEAAPEVSADDASEAVIADTDTEGGVEVAGYAGPTPDGEQLAVAYAGGGSRERSCLMRAMYFESNRSSKEGLLAVGTVVMNRVQSGRYANSVCGVVGQRGQFAPGVMSRKMRGDMDELAAIADSILAGKRHPKIHPKVMFFHQAGLRFPYKNMHYVHVAGGNAFYEKRSRRRR